MKKSIVYLAFSFLLLLLGTCLNGQTKGRNPGYLEYEQYTFVEGLPGVYPNKMAQDSNGILWIAMEVGLVAFDGYDFVTYPPSVGNEDLNFLNNLFISSNGTIFCSGKNKLLNFDPKTETFSEVQIVPQGEKVKVQILDILEDILGNVWLATTDGLTILKKKPYQEFEIFRINSIFQEGGYTSLLERFSSNISQVNKLKINPEKDEDKVKSIEIKKGGEYVIISYEELPIDVSWKERIRIENEGGDLVWAPEFEKSVSFGRPGNRIMLDIHEFKAGSYNLFCTTTRSAKEDGIKKHQLRYNNLLGLTVIPLKNLDNWREIKSQISSLRKLEKGNKWLNGQVVFTLFEDFEGKILVGTNNGLEVFSNEPYGQKIDNFPYPYIKHFQYKTSAKNKISALQVHKISKGSGKEPWVSGYNPSLDSTYPFTLEKVDLTRERFVQIPNTISRNPKKKNTGGGLYVKDIIAVDQYVWVSTTKSGLYKVPTHQKDRNDVYAKDQFFYDFHPTSIGPVISDIFLDQNKNLWVNTYTDYIFKLNSRSGLVDFIQIPTKYKPTDRVPGSVLADRKGRVWINNVHYNKLFCYDLIKQEFLESDINGINPESLYLMHDDQYGNIWLGSFSGKVSRYDISKNELSEFKISEDGAAFPYFEDKEGKIWVADRSSRISRFDPITETLAPGPTMPDSSKMKSNGEPFYMSYYDSIIWIGYPRGLAKVTWKQSRDSSDFIYQEFPEHIRVFHMMQDENQNLWIATFGEGLKLLDQSGKVLKSFTTQDGLLNNNVVKIYQDKRSRLWIHTLGGLQYFDPAKNVLLSNNFIQELAVKSQYGQTYQAQDGRFYISQSEGIYSFDLDKIEIDSIPPKLILKNLLIYQAKNLNDTILKITYTKETQLKFNQNTIAISYAGIHYNNPKEHLYAHRLVGLNNNWQEVGKERVARYNKLPPGKYTFEVKSANSDGVWTDEPTTLQITIRPPWFWNGWSKSLYILVALGLLFFLYQFQLNRQLAEAEARRLTELDTVKTQLYTNITHEFRTPLTVISGMAEQVLDNPQKWFREGLEMIKRNSSHLLQLVNQLLDLSKLESGSLAVSMIQDDIVSYLKYVVESFQSFANSKEIQLSLISKVSHLNMDFDPTKTQSIYGNLLSNAIKFTPNGGVIQVEIDEVSSQKDQHYCQIRISDSGPGIPKTVLPHIFNRFYQADNSATRQAEGTGIGLALTKELVEILQGEIEVESKTGVGTTFIVKLPISREAQAADARAFMIPITEAGPLSSTSLPDSLVVPDVDQPAVLLIEDNTDVLQYLSSCLAGKYQLSVALNGEEGIAKAIENIPDIIISDVMMPKKDGFEVLQTLKNDERTSHIPIVMLTAKADIQSKLVGLEYGADAYLAKPFHKTELLVRLRKLIEIRKVLQLYYQNLTSNSTTINNMIMKEDTFLLKVRRSVESNISDENFGITELCDVLAISRTQLHRKLKAVTGKSTSYVVRSIRLKKAKTLLQSTDLNVSEVGYEVGYANSSHFAQDFRKEFGQAPSKFKKK